MFDYNFWIPLIGAASFGAVVGWLSHNVFQRAEILNASWLASMIGIIAGGAVTAIFQKENLFGAYCIGPGFAFFFRVVTHPIANAIKDEMELDRLKREAAAAARKAKAEASKSTS